MVNTTELTASGQPALETVQVNVAVCPDSVTAVVAVVGLVMVADPLVTVQSPMLGAVTVFAAIVKVATLHWV